MNSSHLLAITFLLATPHLYAMEMDEDELPQPEKVLKWNSGSPVWSLRYSPDCGTLATGHENGMVQIRSTTNGALLTEWNGDESRVTSLEYMYDRRDGYKHDNAELEIGNLDWVTEIRSLQGNLISRDQTSVFAYVRPHDYHKSFEITFDNQRVKIKPTGSRCYDWVMGHFLNPEGRVIKEWDTESPVRWMERHYTDTSFATGHQDGTVIIWKALPVLVAYAIQQKRKGNRLPRPQKIPFEHWCWEQERIHVKPVGRSAVMESENVTISLPEDDNIQVTGDRDGNMQIISNGTVLKKWHAARCLQKVRFKGSFLITTHKKTYLSYPEATKKETTKSRVWDILSTLGGYSKEVPKEKDDVE